MFQCVNISLVRPLSSLVKRLLFDGHVPKQYVLLYFQDAPTQLHQAFSALRLVLVLVSCTILVYWVLLWILVVGSSPFSLSPFPQQRYELCEGGWVRGCIEHVCVKHYVGYERWNQARLDHWKGPKKKKAWKVKSAAGCLHFLFNFAIAVRTAEGIHWLLTDAAIPKHTFWASFVMPCRVPWRWTGGDALKSHLWK